MSGPLLALAEMDGRLLRALLLRRRPFADRFMRRLTRLGDPIIIMPFTLALAAGAVPPLQEAGMLAFLSGGLSHLVVQIAKRWISRDRPRLPRGLGFLIEPEDRFSFPSGHATASLCLAIALFLAVGGVVGSFLVVLGLTVGMSRCYLGVHYPGDVLVGWVLAVGAVAGLVSVGF